jgi:predicted dehydrogenase
MDVVLAGTGGYGGTYVDMLLDNKHGINWVGAVDPYAKEAETYHKFRGLLPIYDTLQEFYAKHRADLAIIATPIHWHYEHSITALKNGSYVLCEKPLVPTTAQLDGLDAVLQETGLGLAVGFQWCHSETILGLKARIMKGEFGKPLNFKTLLCWPRDWKYYNRSSWAGKHFTAEGQPVNDSVASNATAHYIQNMLFLLGDSMEESAYINNLQYECYRANDIETFDTITFRGNANGAVLYYAASHGLNYQIDLTVDFAFEKARILLNAHGGNDRFVIHHYDGRIEKLGEGMGNGHTNRLLYTVQSIKGERPWVCTAKTVRPITALFDAVFEGPFMPFPAERIVTDSKNRMTYVKGLHLDLLDCYHKERLLSENQR